VKRLVLAALAVNAIIWDSTAGTVRPSTHERPAMKDVPAAWSMTEPVAAPDLSVHVW
jgi:hypothetical protein